MCKSISLPFKPFRKSTKPQSEREGGAAEWRPNVRTKLCLQRVKIKGMFEEIRTIFSPPVRKPDMFFFFFTFQPQSETESHLSPHHCQQVRLWNTSELIVETRRPPARCRVYNCVRPSTPPGWMWSASVWHYLQHCVGGGAIVIISERSGLLDRQIIQTLRGNGK